MLAILRLSTLLLVVALTLSPALSDDSRPSPAQIEAVLKAVDKAVETEYYDPGAAMVWLEHSKERENRIAGSANKQDAVDEIRGALSELHNSHVFFYTREEWELRQNVLPFSFEKREGRIFVRASFAEQLKFGDEITRIDEQPLSALRPKSLARLSSVYGNPLYGPPASVAKIAVRSQGQTHDEKLTRLNLKDVSAVQTRRLSDGTTIFHFLSFPDDPKGATILQQSWMEAMNVRGLVLDLRDCSGGWMSGVSYVLDSLIGTTREPFKIIDRNGVQIPPAKMTLPSAPRFKGPVVVLIGDDTQSGCEMLAAGLKESKRAVLAGDRTAGALNGYTQSVSLPDDFALFALPYTRTESPKNVSYEGIGVTPDHSVTNTIEDFRSGKDRVLETGLRLLRH